MSAFSFPALLASSVGYRKRHPELGRPMRCQPNYRGRQWQSSPQNKVVIIYCQKKKITMKLAGRCYWLAASWSVVFFSSFFLSNEIITRWGPDTWLCQKRVLRLSLWIRSYFFRGESAIAYVHRTAIFDPGMWPKDVGLGHDYLKKLMYEWASLSVVCVISYSVFLIVGFVRISFEILVPVSRWLFIYELITNIFPVKCFFSRKQWLTAFSSHQIVIARFPHWIRNIPAIKSSETHCLRKYFLAQPSRIVIFFTNFDWVRNWLDLMRNSFRFSAR